MIYIPERVSMVKKNACPDCFSCQWCGNERCRVCRSAISYDLQKKAACLKKGENGN